MPASRVFCFCANKAGFSGMLRGQQVPVLGSTLLLGGLGKKGTGRWGQVGETA